MSLNGRFSKRENIKVTIRESNSQDFNGPKNLDGISSSQVVIPSVFHIPEGGRDNTQVQEVKDSIRENLCTWVCGRRHIGKTSIVCSAISQIQNKAFDFILYLKDYSKVQSTDFRDWLKIPTQQSEGDLLDLLCKFAFEFRSLIVFDGISTNNKAYVEFVEKISKKLNGCQISRIVFICDGRLNSQGRKIEITGLHPKEVETVFMSEGICVEEEDVIRISAIYNSMPIYIKIAAEYCKRFLGGDVKRFLQEERLHSSGVEKLLEKQYNDLNPLDIRILLSSIVSGTDLNAIRDSLIEIKRQEFDDAINRLEDLNFIKVENGRVYHASRFIYDYCKNRLFNLLASDLEGEHKLLSDFSLISNTSNMADRGIKKEFLNEFLQYCKAKDNLDDRGLYQKIQSIWRRNKPNANNDSFAGNIINMLICLGDELSDLDFSNSYIKNCDFSNSRLNKVNFDGARFSSCKFMNDFGCVTALATSKEYKLIAAGFFSGLIIVWRFSGSNSFREEQIVMFNDERHNVIFDICFNGNNLWVAGKDGNIGRWIFDENNDFAFWKVCEDFHISDSPVRSICVSSDNKSVYSVSEDGMLYHRDMGVGTKEVIDVKPYRLKCLAINHSETQMAFAGDKNEVTILDLKNQSKKIISVNNNWIRSIDFFGDNVLICAGDSGNINIIYLSNQADEKIQDIIKVDKNKVWSVASIPALNAIAAGCANGVIKIYKLNNYHLHQVLSGHTNWVRCLALHDKTLISGGEDQTICVWAPRDDAEHFEAENTLKGYARRVFSLDVDNEKIISGHGDHSICQYDLTSDPPREHPVRIFQCSDQVWSVSVSSSLIGAGCDTGDIYVIDKDRENFQRRFLGNYHHGWIGCVKFSPDGHYLAAGDEQGNIYVFHTQNKYRIKQPIHQYVAHDSHRVSCALFLQDMVVSAGEDGHLVGHNFQAATRCFDAPISDGLIYAMCAISNNTVICGDSKGDVYKYNIQERRLDIIAHCEYPVWSIAHKGTDKLYVGLDNGEVRCYSFLGEKIANSIQHTNQVWCLCFIEQKNLLVSGGEDSMINVYDGDSLIKKFSVEGNQPLQNVSIRYCEGLSDDQRNYLCSMGATD